MPVRFYKQLNTMDCGTACLQMIASYYGRYYNAATIRQLAGFDREGVSLLGISDAAEEIGFKTNGVQLTYEQLTRSIDLPCILHWNQNHFVVLLPLSGWNRRSQKVKIADPARGIVTCTKDELCRHWINSSDEHNEGWGTALLLKPAARFYEKEGEKENKKLNWNAVLKYMAERRWQIMQVFMALVITSVLQLAFPFLTQSIVDVGINTHNLQYITIVLIAQLMLVFSRTIVDFIRSRLLLNISIIVNISILSDFLIKLTRLPIAYFDSYHTGDTLQRINDNKQIQNFLTGPAISFLFSTINFVMFTLVLAMYNMKLFLIFFAGSVAYFLWVRMFLRIRRELNYQTFSISASENNASLELIQGMQEIRLNNAEQSKRWKWEDIQAGIFRLNLKSLTFNQFQQAGALLINQGKDIAITFTVAHLVIQGQLTFGTMLAVQYIIGQLSSPVEQFVSFIQSAQDARISMERLNEVQSLKDEEDAGAAYIAQLPDKKDIVFKSLSFAYPGSGNEPVLNNIDLHIPEGKVTAIVGVSGSGKTTLVKLMLKFYDLYDGKIEAGGIDFRNISHSRWREHCGAVLQEGYIFNDTILRNIIVGDQQPDYLKLDKCCKTANILSFIQSLPNGFETKIGTDGLGISHGQKQRLLIARAIYKDPQYLFFDEATNALDADNEKAIVQNLQRFFKGRTVVVVAHRLSTVKNADNIIVLHMGKIIEEGTHAQLSASKGRYFELVKNQLELGN